MDKQTPAYEEYVRKTYEACLKVETAHAEGAAYDRGFDGGEFSGPASARAAEREKNAIARNAGFPSYDDLEMEAINLGIVSFGGEPDDDEIRDFFGF